MKAIRLLRAGRSPIASSAKEAESRPFQPVSHAGNPRAEQRVFDGQRVGKEWPEHTLPTDTKTLLTGRDAPELSTFTHGV